MKRADGAPGLSVATYLLYAAPVSALAFSGAWISMYLLKFSTDVLLVPAGVVGLWFGVSRAWDAVIDPFLGYWSDRTRTRFGRRRPWMAVAALPTGLLAFAVWSPPSALSGAGLATWVGLGVLLYFTAQSAFGVPYSALGAELCRGHQRTRLFGVRAVFDMLGVFLAAGAIFLLENASDERATAMAIAAAAGLGAVLLLGVPALMLREPPLAHAPVTSARAAFGDVLRNPHARLLICVYFLDQVGFGALVTLLPYLTEYVLALPGTTAHFVAGALGSMLLALPVWIALSRRFGKRGPWIAALLVKAGAFGSLLFAPPGDMLWMSIATAVIGATQAAGAVLGPSIAADVIDEDAERTQQRKEGTYFAAWGLAAQGASGAGVLLAGTALQLSGFDPNTTQSEGVVWAIRAAAAGSPCLFYSVAAALLWRLRIGAREPATVPAVLDEPLISSPLEAEGRR